LIKEKVVKEVSTLLCDFKTDYLGNTQYTAYLGSKLCVQVFCYSSTNAWIVLTEVQSPKIGK
jgi:hypothetical protein